MPSLLLLSPDGDTASVAERFRTGVAIQATPIVAVIPSDVEAPAGAKVVRVKRDVASITAIRMGMAQLTNTTSTSVLLWPSSAAGVAIVSLLALIDAASRETGAIVALSGTTLDDVPMIVPRDAWLELVTLGEGGLDALASRRRVLRVEAAVRTDAS